MSNELNENSLSTRREGDLKTDQSKFLLNDASRNPHDHHCEMKRLIDTQAFFMRAKRKLHKIQMFKVQTKREVGCC